jgi:integrase
MAQPQVSQHSDSSPQISIRLFHGPGPDAAASDDGDRPSLDWTLRMLYDRHVLPHCRLAPMLNRRPADPKTIEADRNALNHFDRLMGEVPLSRLTDDIFGEFITRLQSEPGPRGKVLAQNTARKIGTHIEYIVAQAGPPSKRHPRAAWLFNDPNRWPLGVPMVPKPPVEASDEERFLSFEEIEALYDESRRSGPTMRHLMSVPGTVWWPNVFLLVYNTSLRINTVMLAERSMIGPGRVPDDFIKIPPLIFKKRMVRPPFCLNRYAQQAIEALRLPGVDRLVPWQCKPRKGPTKPWPAGKSWFFAQFREIAARAGIDLRGQNLATNAFRKAANTWFTKHHPLYAPLIAGHAAKVMTVDVYTQYTAVREIVNQLPQPCKGKLFA